MSDWKNNFRLNTAIFINFMVVALSFIILEMNSANFFWGLHRSIWVWIHVCAGLTFVAGLMIHILRHGWWLKAAFSFPGDPERKKNLRNRTINKGLLFFFPLTILSGAMNAIESSIMVTGGIPAEAWNSQQSQHILWTHIHGFSAMVMLILVVSHLIAHRRH